MTPIVQELTALPVEEQLLIVEELWDSISANPENIPISEEEKAEMLRRVQEYRKDGIKGDTWDVVRKRIEAKL